MVVRRVDPLAMAEQIRALFISNGNRGAATWFDRTFGRMPDHGGASWVSIDADARVVAHVAALPMRISHGGRDLDGAVFCNLMADQAHRTFFPILAVVKRAVKDLQADGVEFIMTNPSNPGAVAVMKAAGVKQVATHGRYLCMLGDARPVVDLVIGLHVQARVLLASALRTRQVEPAVAADWTVRNVGHLASVTARRAPRQYAMRYEAFGGPEDIGFIFADSRGSEVGAAIVRRAVDPGEAVLITLRCASPSHVPGAAAALGSALRSLGLRRLDALAVVGSSLARGLVRGGFIARNEPWVIAATGFTDDARAALASMGDSDLERVDLD